MGTGTTKELQREIKNLISGLGWSQKRFAREIYFETHEVHNDDEERRFVEKFKKELSRTTIKPERLVEYLNVISRHAEVVKINLITPSLPDCGCLSETFKKGMKSISESISKELRNEGDL